MKRHIRAFLPTALAVAFAGLSIATARADDVTDWNQIMFQAALVAKTSPLDMSRNAAIVQAAVYDAVNGIDRRHEPYFVPSNVTRSASKKAAASAAAHDALVALFPASAFAFDDLHAATLAGVREGPERRIGVE